MILDFILDLIFPALCVNCESNTDNRNFICDACLSKVEIFSGMFCGKCKARIPEARKICHKDTPYILAAATSYGNEAVRSMVHALKFRGIRALAKPMSEILLKYTKEESISGDVIVPIPLGKLRERQRGYNQAELLAELLSRNTGIPVLHALKRIRETQPQSEIKTREEKIQNVSDSFEASPEIKNKKIILLDDVTTSGGTFLSASRALKIAGAKKIIALSVCRA